VRGRFALPEGGVAVPVTFGVLTFGSLVLEPQPLKVVDDVQRRFAVAVAEVLAVTLAALGERATGAA